MRAIAFATDNHRFVACLPFVLVQEGVPGNSDNKNDPGGTTHEGIIQTDYNVFCRAEKLPFKSVYLATDAQVDQIYYESYWMALAHKMPVGLDLSVMDNDVNEGVGEGSRLLQRVLGVLADGQWGPQSAIALQTMTSVHGIAAVITSYALARSTYYHSLSDDRFFDADWQRRTTTIRDASLKMAAAA